MTTRRDPDRLIQAFLLEGQTELADQVYDAVRSTVEHRRQRVFIGPWRFPDMNKLVPIGLGAAAVIAVLFVGGRFLGTPNQPGAAPTPVPTATVAPSVAEPSQPSGSVSPLSQSFTSKLHGLSLSYPAGWTAQGATEPWPQGIGFPLSFEAPQVDWLYDPNLNAELFLAIASQPIGDATPDDWVAEQMASEEGCGAATVPVTVDGASGVVGHPGCAIAVVTTAGRGYWIQLYTGASAPTGYDHAWFEEVVAGVQLHPEDAVGVAPSTSP